MRYKISFHFTKDETDQQGTQLAQNTQLELQEIRASQFGSRLTLQSYHHCFQHPTHIKRAIV